MKKPTNKIYLGGVALVLATALPVMALADQAGGFGTSLPSADSNAQVTGVVSAKGEKAVTVNGQSIAVNDQTRVRRGTDRLSLDDLKPGDNVVISTKQVDGQLVAVLIEIIPAG